jgi:hypothetical protein
MRRESAFRWLGGGGISEGDLHSMINMRGVCMTHGVKRIAGNMVAKADARIGPEGTRGGDQCIRRTQPTHGPTNRQT